MHVNLITRNSFRTQCQFNVLFNRLHLKNATSANKSAPICSCPNLKYLTSKPEFLQPKRQEDLFLRTLCTDSGPPSNRLPALMDFPNITWPSLIKSIRNFFLATFIIRPYFDRDFDLADFVAGSKKAVEVISQKISDGDIKSLEGLVSSDIIPSLQRATALMSLSQREEIAINVDDIYFSFPYQVGVMFNDDNSQKRFVEITMVFHALRGLSIMKAQGEEPPLNMGMLPEYQNRISICNYRFIREFTKGIESDWTVNLLNHFKPVDQTQQ